MASPSPYPALYASYTIDLNKTDQESFYDHHSSPPFSKNPVPDRIVYNSYMESQLHPTLEVCKSEICDQEALDVYKGSRKCPKLKFTICKGSGVGGEDQTENRDLICNNDDDNTTIRVCSDCKTTKTPLWRSGPRGPKSLCNACGIRQRKARRAISAATNGSPTPNWMSGSMVRAGNELKKGSTSTKNGVGAVKKRSKIVKPTTRQPHHNVAQRKLWFDEFATSLTKKLSIQQVFPKEEKEAAILLMALSCGLVQ